MITIQQIESLQKELKEMVEKVSSTDSCQISYIKLFAKKLRRLRDKLDAQLYQQ